MTVENAMAYSSQEKGNSKIFLIWNLHQDYRLRSPISTFSSGQSNGTVISYLLSVRTALLPRKRYCRAGLGSSVDRTAAGLMNDYVIPRA